MQILIRQGNIDYDIRFERPDQVAQVQAHCQHQPAPSAPCCPPIRPAMTSHFDFVRLASIISVKTSGSGRHLADHNRTYTAGAYD
ncbi:MAG: hypothetical protein MZV63_03870 [Marinilabiliales bacterium]|nr:hypothetical protein [Marinilabiliales bacterium]